MRVNRQLSRAQVKLIGATGHAATADLDDEGPNTEQETRRIDQADSPTELRRVGRDIERTVLARGRGAHLQDRVLLNGNKTVVFSRGRRAGRLQPLAARRISSVTASGSSSGSM